MKKKIVIVGAIIIVIAALFAMCGGDGNSNDSVYNPQIEMFQSFKTKSSFPQNETFI